MATMKQSDKRTPNGGVRSVIFFLDSEGKLVDESVAAGAKIEEYDSNGNIIHRTYLAKGLGDKGESGGRKGKEVEA